MENKKSSKRIRFGSISYLSLAIIFAIFVIIQVFLAGLATFANPINWVKHSTFIHAFGFNIPIFMLVMAFVAKMPRWTYWQIFGLLFLIFTMYFTANMRGPLPWAAAAHPVLAMLLFMLSMIIVTKTWRFVKENKKN